VPTKKLLTSELGCDFESSESEATVAKKKKKAVKVSQTACAHVLHSENEGPSQVPPVERHAPQGKPKGGKLSVRDRIWNLLHDSEKKQLLSDEMSAAEGAFNHYLYTALLIDA
jgi:hypothetical protein